MESRGVHWCKQCWLRQQGKGKWADKRGKWKRRKEAKRQRGKEGKRERGKEGNGGTFGREIGRKDGIPLKLEPKMLALMMARDLFLLTLFAQHLAFLSLT
jgi:hypothetical protein